LGATLVRIVSSLAALVLVGAAAWDSLDIGEVHAAIEASPQPDWNTQERPYRAFALNSPTLPEADYAIRRHTAGGRKDILTAGVEQSGPRLMIEIYRPGRESTGFDEAAAEVAARTEDIGGPYTLRSADALDSKFGPIALFEFTALTAGRARNCLGFARTFDEPLLLIAGWYCAASTDTINRRTLACALEGLSLLATASDPKVQELFAEAEQKRTFCNARTVETAPR
jgi:hypothetical protein